MKRMRKFLRRQCLYLVLSERRWYRRWHGGRWGQVHIDLGGCGRIWLRVPDGAGEDYREPLWRGTPNWEVWP